MIKTKVVVEGYVDNMAIRPDVSPEENFRRTSDNFKFKEEYLISHFNPANPIPEWTRECEMNLGRHPYLQSIKFQITERKK